MRRPDASPEYIAARKSAKDQFEYIVKPARARWDDDVADPEATTYTGATHGPDPVPDWVITSDAARQYELGVLKTGKEADVFLLERTLEAPEGAHRNLLAAKRYRSTQHRTFRNDAAYRVGKAPLDDRVARAMAKKTGFGMQARAGMWALREFETLAWLWSEGLPVPYPVQQSGTELVLEFLGDDDGAAPRLVQARPSRAEAAALCEQAVALLTRFAELKVAHADLSPYNVLVWEDRLWVIDMPQAASLTDNARAAEYNPNALDFFHRDVVNLLGWFSKKGVDVDPEAVFTDLVTVIYAA